MLIYYPATHGRTYTWLLCRCPLALLIARDRLASAMATTTSAMAVAGPGTGAGRGGTRRTVRRRAVAAAASSDVERTASASEGSSRRGVMRLALGSAAWLGGGGGGGGGGWVAVAAEAEGLQSLADYRAALDRAKLELDGIANDLRASAGSSANVFAIIIEENELEDQFDEPPAVVPLSPSARAGLKARLHDGELGRAGQISLATSLDASQLMNETRVQNALGDVAWRALSVRPSSSGGSGSRRGAPTGT